jgi:two-component system response regulator AtoC
MPRILIADDQEMMRDSLCATLARDGHDVVAASDGAGAVAKLSAVGAAGRFDLLITDLKMPRMTGTELLAEAKRLRPEMPVVLMTAFATVATAVEAMKLGAYDYIQKPFDGDEIKLLVDRTLEHARLLKENAALRSVAEQQLAPRPLIGTGPAMKEVRQRIEQVARSSATVLVRGETGTGKEVVARAIHAASARRDQPSRNCSATRKGPSPAPTAPAGADLSWPTAGRSCLTRSARSPPRSRPSCCACCRRAPSSASAAA